MWLFGSGWRKDHGEWFLNFTMPSVNWGFFDCILADAQARCSGDAAVVVLSDASEQQIQWSFGAPSDSEFEDGDDDATLQHQCAFGVPSDSETSALATLPASAPATPPAEAATPARREQSRLYTYTHM